MKKELYEWFLKVIQLGNRAVKNAQIENLKKGLPNIFCKNGKIYYELPDGTITMEKPEILKK
jgi:hypothetical protein